MRLLDRRPRGQPARCTQICATASRPARWWLVGGLGWYLPTTARTQDGKKSHSSTLLVVVGAVAGGIDYCFDYCNYYDFASVGADARTQPRLQPTQEAARSQAAIWPPTSPRSPPTMACVWCEDGRQEPRRPPAPQASKTTARQPPATATTEGGQDSAGSPYGPIITFAFGRSYSHWPDRESIYIKYYYWSLRSQNLVVQRSFCKNKNKKGCQQQVQKGAGKESRTSL